MMLRTLIAVVLLLSVHQIGAYAAEIECDYVSNGPYPEEIARQWWPSGFRPVDGMCINAYLHGSIERGDYEKVAAFYRKNHRLLSGMNLQSNGGNVAEAIKIGRLVRKYLISVSVPSLRGSDQFSLFIGTKLECRGPQCECASACSLIWFGSTERFGTVGLHRPRITDPEFSSLTPSEAASVYRQTLNDISSYMDEMEVPRPIIDAMVATGSSDIKWVDAVDDNLERPPSFAEWLDANCGHLTPAERKTLNNLTLKNFINPPLTRNEATLYQRVEEADDRIMKCEITVVHAQVDRLAAP